MVSCLDTKMWFGKYKGSTVGEVLKENPRYLLWAHEKTDTFRMSDELLDMAANGADSCPLNIRRCAFTGEPFEWFKGLHVVMFAMVDPNTVMHKPSKRCPQEYPHEMVKCGEFNAVYLSGREAVS
jgi:hypothetical protein